MIVACRMIAAGEELLIHPSSDADYFRGEGVYAATHQYLLADRRLSFG